MAKLSRYEFDKKERKLREIIDNGRFRIDECGCVWIKYVNGWREIVAETDYYKMVFEVYKVEKVIEECECKMTEANAAYKESYDRKNALELKKMALRKNYELRYRNIPKI